MIKSYVVFDLETTGLRAETDEIIEIGALKVVDGKVTQRFTEFVKPKAPISSMITGITGITNDMVANARETRDIIRDFVDFCKDFVLVGHNIMFDYKFMKKYAEMYELSFQKQGIDTLKIARKMHKDLESKSLGTLCTYYGITNQAAHRAYHDALATAKLYHMLAHQFEQVAPELFQAEWLQYAPKKAQACTAKQLQYLKALCLYHNINMPEHAERRTRSEMSKLIDHIIATRGNSSG